MSISYRILALKAVFELTTKECMDIWEALRAFEIVRIGIRRKGLTESEIFPVNFILKIGILNRVDLYSVFRKINKDHKSILRIERLHVDNMNCDLMNDDIESVLFGRHHKEISLLESEIVEVSCDLSSLIVAFDILENYEKAMRYKSNMENADSNFESDDWTPPDNFRYGTEDEQEIWEMHNKKGGR
jgi:hypothetical protein